MGWQWEGVAGCLSSALDSEEANGWSDDVDGLSLLRHSSSAVRLPVAAELSDSKRPRLWACRQLSQTREDLTARCFGLDTRTCVEEQLWQKIMPHALPIRKATQVSG